MVETTKLDTFADLVRRLQPVPDRRGFAPTVDGPRVAAALMLAQDETLTPKVACARCGVPTFHGRARAAANLIKQLGQDRVQLPAWWTAHELPGEPQPTTHGKAKHTPPSRHPQPPEGDPTTARRPHAPTLTPRPIPTASSDPFAGLGVGASDVPLRLPPSAEPPRCPAAPPTAEGIFTAFGQEALDVHRFMGSEWPGIVYRVYADRAAARAAADARRPRRDEVPASARAAVDSAWAVEEAARQAEGAAIARYMARLSLTRRVPWTRCGAAEDAAAGRACRLEKRRAWEASEEAWERATVAIAAATGAEATPVPEAADVGGASGSAGAGTEGAVVTGADVAMGDAVAPARVRGQRGPRRGKAGRAAAKRAAALAEGSANVE